MARSSQDLPPWVPLLLGVALVGGAGWRFADSLRLPTSRLGSEAASGPQPVPEPALDRGQGLAPDPAPEPERLRIDVLGREPVARFAFDPTRDGRVVTCESESLDGGETWRRLGDSPIGRAIALGGSRAAAPVLRAGRILCGDAILPAGPGAPGGARVGDVQSAVEWNGRDWRPLGLPLAQAAGTPADGQVTVAVGYDGSGSPFAVRADRLLTPSGEHALPGAVTAWATHHAGAVHAVVAAHGRRARLLWADAPQAGWGDVPTPGDLRAMATDGDQVWVAAGMLGRGRRDAWQWTRWPEGVRVDGVAGWGQTVVAWGERPDRDDRGALVVSRDGGATLELRRIERLQPIWGAVDPHSPGDVLLLGEDGTIARVRLD
jgi:hypothetical protein